VGIGVPGQNRRIDLSPWAWAPCQHVHPRSGAPPEEMEEEQGVQARAPMAMTVTEGAKNAPLGRRRRPPDAWRASSTMPDGVSADRLCRIHTPLASSVRRGKPRLLPRQVRGRRSEAPALGWSGRHAGRGIGLQPPAPVLRGGSRTTAVSSPRPAHESRSRRRSHH
jgi:hypothetical protein